jgi:hypothetical protein
METKEYTTQQFENAITRVLGKVLAVRYEYLAICRVVSVRASVRRLTATSIIKDMVYKDVKYSRGVTGVTVGDICLVAIPDPRNKKNAFVVGVY